jgi:hypothetical protein
LSALYYVFIVKMVLLSCTTVSEYVSNIMLMTGLNISPILFFVALIDAISYRVKRQSKILLFKPAGYTVIMQRVTRCVFSLANNKSIYLSICQYC